VLALGCSTVKKKKHDERGRTELYILFLEPRNQAGDLTPLCSSEEGLISLGQDVKRGEWEVYLTGGKKGGEKGDIIMWSLLTREMKERVPG
jgi:hypothetical protein